MIPKPERWAFSPSELTASQGLNAKDELIAHPANWEQGVIVLRNGEVSNRWEDGTVGVPPLERAFAESVETLRHPGTAELTEGWYDVWVLPDGRLAAFRAESAKSCVEETMTLAEHAEAWARENGREVPERDTPEWEQLYAAWLSFAFADFPGDGLA